MRLEGQVTSITGVSHAGQVGYALAAAFAREGALLSISARTASRVHARAEELRTQGARVIACTRAVWPVMKRQGGGKILNFSRAGGVQSSRPMMPAYNCAKVGIDALTYTFARVGKEFGIAVNALGPGLVTTQSNVESMKPTPEELRATWGEPGTDRRGGALPGLTCRRGSERCRTPCPGGRDMNDVF